jgi:F-type H+-transporting ATPase subunit c
MKLAARFLSVLPLVLLATTAMAQDTAPASGLTEKAIKYISYFFAIAFAAYAGTSAQSKAASVALEGISRNPSAADKIMTPMILALALMESLVIFVLISVFLVG